MRIRKISLATSAGCGFFLLAISIAGYLSFLSHTSNNFLTNYPGDEFLPFTCRCLFTISLIVGLVVNNHPSTSTMVDYLQRHFGKNQDPQSTDEISSTPERQIYISYNFMHKFH